MGIGWYIKSYLESVDKQCTIVKVLEQPVRIVEEGPKWMTANVGETLEYMMLYACLEASKNGGNQFVYFKEQLAKERANI